MAFRLGIDLGFARNRYQEAEVWTRIVREELGLGYVSLVADILNPDWPEDYLRKLVKKLTGCLKEYDMKVEVCFTSALTRTPHLMHDDEEMRRYYLDWFKRFFALAAALGCKRGGSHFGIMSVEDYENAGRRARILEEGVKGWQELSFYARDIGFECLLFEPMSVPREMANTVCECRQLMDMVNANSAIPLKLCLDVGHAPHPDERDPYPWIEQLGKDSPMVHLQQTVLHKSNHSPFIKEFNDAGVIEPEKVMNALKISGATDALLAFEISHREHYDTDFRVIQDLKESVAYWRPYVNE
jgi:sugar phosphate isomerase/epimerase